MVYKTILEICRNVSLCRPPPLTTFELEFHFSFFQYCDDLLYL